MQKLEYIHLDPEKAGIVPAPEDYRYAAAACYCNGKMNGLFYRITMADWQLSLSWNGTQGN